MEALGDNAHAKKMFDRLFENEESLCGEFAVFYHSYSHSALLYEVRAAIASILLGFDGQSSPLPRLLEEDFEEVPSAEALMERVASEWGPTKSDHRPEFRRVGISVMCSLLARGPECCMQIAFFDGYSCKKVAFRQVLEEELRRGLGISADKASILVPPLMEIASRHGLDCSILGGGQSPSGFAGHILQIFVHLSVVDHLCYAAQPYGEIDEERMPLSAWLSGDRDLSWGQARILAHPSFFTDPEVVRMFVVSADPTFHAGRAKCQEELRRHLLSVFSAAAAAAGSARAPPKEGAPTRPPAALRPQPLAVPVRVISPGGSGLPLAPRERFARGGAVSPSSSALRLPPPGAVLASGRVE